MRTVSLGLTDLNTWVLVGGVVWREFLAGRKYVTVGGSGLKAALPPRLVWLPCFVFPVGGVVSLLPTPAFCHHASLAVRDSHSGTISQNKLFLPYAFGPSVFTTATEKAINVLVMFLLVLSDARGQFY